MVDQHKDEDKIREVYARYGLAMYMAQCIERGLGVLLAGAWGPGPSRIGKTEYEKLLGWSFRQALGGLIRKVRQQVSVDDDLEAQLADALNKRNWLAHRYFWDRSVQFCSPDSLDLMIVELQEIVDAFELLDGRLRSLSEKWLKELGVADEQLQAGLRDLLESAPD